jgi:hypothetical protein
MGKVSRLFATEEMKMAAKEFRENAQAHEYFDPVYTGEDEDKLLEDYFLAGCVWYKTLVGQKNKSNMLSKEKFEEYRIAYRIVHEIENSDDIKVGNKNSFTVVSNHLANIIAQNIPNN